jgi:hypothetical protein
MTAPHPTVLNAAIAADFGRSRRHYRTAEVNPTSPFDGVVSNDALGSKSRL